jgi:hypothetical protein
MKTLSKIENQFRMIENIRYENENGGAYAYVQFLAYSRELARLLRPLKKVEKHIETIESISWLFNEYLAVKFTHRQKAIFENKMLEVKEVFDTLRKVIREFEIEEPVSTRIVHKQAA